jgi:hypothetical protein
MTKWWIAPMALCWLVCATPTWACFHFTAGEITCDPYPWEQPSIVYVEFFWRQAVLGGLALHAPHPGMQFLMPNREHTDTAHLWFRQLDLATRTMDCIADKPLAPSAAAMLRLLGCRGDLV